MNWARVEIMLFLQSILPKSAQLCAQCLSYQSYFKGSISSKNNHYQSWDVDNSKINAQSCSRRFVLVIKLLELVLPVANRSWIESQRRKVVAVSLSFVALSCFARN